MNTFKKRKGTTNKGGEYEDYNVAKIVLELITNRNITNFYLSSNDENFGAFDDIVVETETQNGSEICAIQLKHSDKATLCLESLTKKDGNFSLKKYFNSFQEIQKSAHKFILFTNLKFNPPGDSEFILENENFQVRVLKLESLSDMWQISSKTDYCFKFEIVDDGVNDPRTEEYKRFFQKFFLYVDQENLHQLKKTTTKMFHQTFWQNEAVDKFLKIISEWSKQEGRKQKLSKAWTQDAIAVHLFSSHIKPICLGPVNDKMKIFQEAVSHFDITVFEEDASDQLGRLWGDVEVITTKEINRVRKEFQLWPVDVIDVDNADPVLLSKVLWLTGKSPLIVDDHPHIDKLIRLCPGKKIILLGTKKLKKSNSVLQNLSNLKKVDTNLYQKIVENFTCSVQNKEAVNLKTLIGQNESFLRSIKIDALLKMILGPCEIGGEQEILVHPYIERLLKLNILDIRYLSEIRQDSVVILDSILRLEKLETYLKNHKIIYFDGEFNKNEKIQSQDFSGPTVYVSKSKCNYFQFEKIFQEKDIGIKNCHQFRVLDGQKLRWIRSKGDVNDLERYRTNDEYFISEKMCWSLKPENNINVIVSNPGMGKTELMKSFQQNSRQKNWTIFISSNDINSFLKKTKGKKNVDEFVDFILTHKYSYIKHCDLCFLDFLIQEKNINLVWDGIDEVFEHLEIVTEIIVEFSKRSFVQWVTSRPHLKTFLQNKFHVLAIDITQFTQKEQIFYIKKRLNCVSENEINIIIKKIESTFQFIQHQDLLGIPLQIFMLTELLLQNRETYIKLLKNDFVLTDLYHYFIKEKMNIYYRDKSSIDLENREINNLVSEKKRKTLKHYEKVALRSIFGDKILKLVNANFKKELRKVQESYQNHQSIGLIIEICDGIPKFFHNSFAEYFVAVFLSKNLEITKNLKDTLFDENYVNVRFFFDMLLAKNCKPHINVLNKNFTFLKQCDEIQLQSKDKGGRNVLHLMCSWGQRYPELKVQKCNATYFIQNDNIFDVIPDSQTYCDLLQFVIEKCDISDKDELFSLTALDYAKQAGCLVPKVKIMQKQDTKIEKADVNRYVINILYYSAELGYGEFLDLFSTYDSVPYVETSKGMCLFNISIRHAFYLRKLLKTHVYKEKINKNFIFGKFPLHFAVSFNHYETTKVLLENGAEIDKKSVFGTTALNIAATRRKIKFVHLLVNRGCDINLGSGFNGIDIKAIIIASAHGYDEIVEFLVKSCAQIDARDFAGATALHHACKYGHGKIVKFLIATGAKIDSPENLGGTPLMVAAENGHEDIVKYLFESGAKVNHTRHDGATAIILAAQLGQLGTVKVLFKSGADVNLAANNGMTSLYLAALFGHERVVKFLVSSGARVNVSKDDNTTPLYVACRHGHAKIVNFLISSGADVNLGSYYNCDTPIVVAFQNHHYTIVMKLLKCGAKCKVSFFYP